MSGDNVPWWRRSRGSKFPFFPDASIEQGRQFGNGWLLWIWQDPDFPCAPWAAFPRRLPVAHGRIEKVEQQTAKWEDSQNQYKHYLAYYYYPTTTPIRDSG